MFSWLRALFFNRSKQTEQKTPPAERHVLAWVDRMIPRANHYLNAYYGNVLLHDLLFLYRSASNQIELWLTDDRSGRNCLERNSKTSIFIGSLDASDWNQACAIILRRLREIARDEKHKYYCRITIESTPDHPSTSIHDLDAHSIILWNIKPSANLVANLPSEPRVNRDAPIFHCGDLPDFSEDGDRSK